MEWESSPGFIASIFTSSCNLSCGGMSAAEGETFSFQPTEAISLESSWGRVEKIKVQNVKRFENVKIFTFIKNLTF